MKYLYGDSAPFPFGFNFLATVEKFLDAATRIVQLESESRSLEISAAAAAAARVRTLDDLQSFHDAIIRAVQDSGSKRVSALTIDYVQHVVEHANLRMQQARENVGTTNDREQGYVRTEVDRRRAEIRKSLEGFLLVGHLPLLSISSTMQLEDNRNKVTVTLAHPGSIVAEFQVAASRVLGWENPRKVSDFGSGINLTVGIKRSLFSREIKLEPNLLDDHVVSGFSLSPTTANIRLRRKSSDPRDALVFGLRRTENGIEADVAHPNEEGTPAISPVDAEDRAQLVRLWEGIEKSARELAEHPEKLLSLKLEDEDVFDHDLAIMFIERVVATLAPTMSEVALRSPNPIELSLKRETSDGRREELYIKKADLVSKVAPLGDKERGIFSPLGLVPAAAAGLPSEQEIVLEDIEDSSP